MVTKASIAGVGAAQPLEHERTAATTRFDWAMAAASLWLVGGLYLDGWAHHRYSNLETFFTPWHGVLYSGLFAAATLLFTTLISNVARGHRWTTALPTGYGLSLLGVLVFFAGGVGDLIWHFLFGIEVSLEALLSPTHMLLAIGGALIVTGPFRAALSRPATGSEDSFIGRAPALISLTVTLGLLTFFTEYANPVFSPLAGVDHQIEPLGASQAQGVISIVVQTGLLMGSVLLALRAGMLPAGSLTLVLTLSTVLGVFPHEEVRFVPVGLVAGLVGDFLVRGLKPSVARPLTVYGFAFTLPAVLYGLYFVVLAVTEGIAWSVHLWTGAIVLAGVVGLLLSFLVVPLGRVNEHTSS